MARDAPESAALSRSRLGRLIKEGHVQVNRRRRSDSDGRVCAGDFVQISIPMPPHEPSTAAAPALDILFEDDHLMVVNKAAGVVVHPAPGALSGTLVHGLLQRGGGALSGVGGAARPGIVHRIDKDTSGLLVVAKSDLAHLGLARQFEAHQVERRYLAVVHGTPQASDPRLCGLRGVRFESGQVLRIHSCLARHRRYRQKQKVNFTQGRQAITRARVVQRFGAHGVVSLVECWLETGRTHQIRAHMAYAGHGVVGDPLYGGRRRLARPRTPRTPLTPRTLPPPIRDAVAHFPRQALHAATLGFLHPVSGEEKRFSSAPPRDMQSLLEILHEA